ncbi:MAG: hypothetical protein E1N59_2877 [Puniceicoccaceae bacterium 5H]|nr:MAG: hypothetical protein E1N59_2877 [Puniceicoccaceae bacterium 5H]
MAYLYWKVGDPLAFLHIQGEWNRETIGFLAVVAGALVRLWTVDLWSGAMPVHLQAIADLSFLAAAVVSGFMVWKRYGTHYGLLVLLGIIIPASTSTVSLCRYSLVLFPMFLLWAEIGLKHPWFDNFVRYAFPIGQAAALALYCNWYFVA